MTREENGGALPSAPIAWEQVEEFYLSSLTPVPAPAAGTIVFGQTSRAGKTTTLEKAERLLRLLHDLPPLALAAALALSSSSIPVASAVAQTAISRTPVSTTPPGRSAAAAQPTNQTQQTQAAQSQQIPAAPPLPMSASSVFQAADQAEGIFPPLSRAGGGGQIQESWNVAEPREGVHTERVCEDCVYKVRTREFMTTTLILPSDVKIIDADLGDPSKFQAKIKAANMVAVRPATYGVDTNLNVYTQSGAVYAFYLRAEGFNSVHVPDLVVKLLGQETPEPIATITPEGAAGGPGVDGRHSLPSGQPGKPGDRVSAAVNDLTNPKAKGGDFVRNVPFDPSKLHGWKDYKLWGGGDAEKELKPVVVYRDDFFTYLQYGEKYDPLELPTAYIVRDGIDELVNSRVQGNTFIVESVNPLISIKSGKSFLCLQYTGEKP